MPTRRKRLTLRLSSAGIDPFLVGCGILGRLSSLAVLSLRLSRVGFCDGGVDVDDSVVVGVVRVAAERARLGVRRGEAARRRALGAVYLFSSTYSSGSP